MFLSVFVAIRLTAFVVKTFCAIQKLDGIDVDVNVISTAINWLTTKQRGDGAIIESHPVGNQKMDVCRCIFIQFMLLYFGVFAVAHFHFL